MERKSYYVYMLTNYTNRVIYTGVTNDLARRMHEHKNKLIDGFTKKYNCTKLVWFVQTESIDSAIAEEKRIKAGSRTKKINRIESINPGWKDLSEDWL